jgi:Cu-Zn family superoxide dismutase
MTGTSAPIWPACAAPLLAACATAPAPDRHAEACLEERSAGSVSGTLSLDQSGDRLIVEGAVTVLAPGEHGFHVHESGDCSAPDATSAKGHFNPAGKPHGHHAGAERHAGDLPNLVADTNGNARQRSELTLVSLGQDANGIVGRSVVIHADPDDYKSQPA